VTTTTLFVILHLRLTVLNNEPHRCVETLLVLCNLFRDFYFNVLQKKA